MHFWVVLVLGVAAAALAYRMFLVEPWRIGTTSHTFDWPDLPSKFDGLRILFLTDLHTSGWGWREVFMRSELERCDHDMLVVTGDLISSPSGIEPALQLLGDQRPPLGIWYVRGNNEVEELDHKAGFLNRLVDLGWNVLMNGHRVLERESDRLVVAGVDDAKNRLDDLGAALGGVNPARDFVLLLSHTPETFDDAACRGVRLVLAGHTHGGQLRWPWLGAPWVDCPRTGLKFQCGVYRSGESVMVLSRGIGWSVLPVRLFCTPEVIRVTLKRTPTSGSKR